MMGLTARMGTMVLQGLKDRRVQRELKEHRGRKDCRDLQDLAR